MKKEKQKLSFFSRIKIAVAKLEDYSLFLEEKVSIGIKYFFLLILIASCIISIVQTYDATKIINKGFDFIKNELPEFSYQDGKLEFSENIQAYDKDVDFYLFTDTSKQVSEDTLNEYQSKIKNYGMIFLENKVILASGNGNIEYDYKELANQYEIESLNKEGLIEKIDSIGFLGITTTIFLVMLVSIFIVKVISIFMDWLLLSIFAYCAVKICKVGLSYKQTFNISIYALTLSILLNVVYDVISYLTGFYMPYFRMMYLLISYVYVVAAIFIIKSDLIKQQIEVTKIVEIQKQVHEELKEEKENEENNKENDKNKEDDKKEDSEDVGEVAGEPDGSEI